MWFPNMARKRRVREFSLPVAAASSRAKIRTRRMATCAWPRREAHSVTMRRETATGTETASTTTPPPPQETTTTATPDTPSTTVVTTSDLASTLSEILALVDEGKCDLVDGLSSTVDNEAGLIALFGQCSNVVGGGLTLVSAEKIESEDSFTYPVEGLGCCPGELIDFSTFVNGESCTEADGDTLVGTDLTVVIGGGFQAVCITPSDD
mmetsp:Transcript_3882/g.10936  ORF Transcript_3882/g.10936 Transcript_3882/m.10936 type:complete len:208 (-) Transcript_3882:128-751(-)